MGQKSNPIGLRLGINKSWDSVWFDEKNFADRIERRFSYKKLSFYLDILLLAFLKFLLIELLRKLVVTINTARPGLIIGKGGLEVDALKKNLKSL